MAGTAAETLIGAAVLAAAAGFLVYAANTADISIGGQGYDLTAKFRVAEGLSPGGDVRIAGVKVGAVKEMVLEPQSYRAVVVLTLRDGIEIPEDSTARITAAGLLGDNFVAITPGGSDLMLEAGEEITYTQSSVSLIDMAGKLIHGAGDTGSGDAGTGAAE